MTQQEFNILSKKYLNGETTDVEDALLLTWFEQHNNPNLAIENAENQANENPEIERKIWQKISQNIYPKRNLFIRLAWISGVAACLLIGLLLFNPKKAIEQSIISENVEKEGIKIENTTSAEQEFTLTDGTIVWLKPNSSLIYDKEFNQTKRAVYFSGEGFFKVKRDVTKPFLVYSGDLVTEVLGTSFRIKPLPNSKEIEVAVSTGKVSVYTNKTNQKNERNGIILTPNQRILFNEDSKSLMPSIVEKPTIIVAEAQVQPLIFESESLQNVLRKFTELYGIEFIITNPKAKDCQITADLTGLPLFTQLELICKSVDANYEKRGTTVFVEGDGCE